jgi:hypothetical protein
VPSLWLASVGCLASIRLCAADFRATINEHPLSRARPQSIDDATGAPRFPLASPEDTIFSKLESFRNGGETSERQWWDIVGVLKVTVDADREYLKRWAPELGVVDLLDRALADAAAP